MVTRTALISRFHRFVMLRPWRWLAGLWATSLVLFWIWKPLRISQHIWGDSWQWSQIWLWLLFAGIALYLYRKSLSHHTRLERPDSAPETQDWLRTLAQEAGEQHKPWYLLLNPMELDSAAWLQQLENRRQQTGTFRPLHEHATSLQAWIGTDATLLEPRNLKPTGSFDEDLWSQLCSTLRQCRPCYPLHGILLLLDPQWILDAGQQASRVTRQLASHLQKLAELLQIHPRLYCYTTHLGALEGFTIWVQSIPPHHQQPLLGVQFSQHRHHWPAELHTFWRQWLRRLSHEVPPLLLGHDAQSDRASLFRLTREIEDLQLASQRWLQQLLDLQPQIELRGFFLGDHGSLPQASAEPGDRKVYGLTDETNVHYQLQTTHESNFPHAMQVHGFMASFWREQIQPEAGFCAPAPGYLQRQRRKRRAVLATMCLASLLLLGGWHYFYLVNQARLQQWQSRLTSQTPLGLTTPHTSENALALQLKRLDNLLDAQQGEVTPAPASHLDHVKEMGLYQSVVLQQGVHNRYLAELEHRLLPSVMGTLIRQMNAATAGSLDKLQWLTLIQLLDDPRGIQGTWIAGYLRQQLTKLFDPRNPGHEVLNKVDQQRLIRHLELALHYTRWAEKRASGDPQASRDYAPFADAVHQAQVELLAVPPSERLFQQLAAMAAEYLPPPLDLHTLIWPDEAPASGPIGAGDEEDESASPGSATRQLPLIATDDKALLLPRLVTRQGWQYMLSQKPRLLQQAALDLCVLGQTRHSAKISGQELVRQDLLSSPASRASQQLWQQLLFAYQQDAETRWQAALDSLEIPVADNKAQLLQQLAQFTQPEQPLSRLLQRLTQEMATSIPQPLQETDGTSQTISAPNSLTPAVPLWQSWLSFQQPQNQHSSRLTELEQELRSVETYLQPILRADDQGASALAALQAATAPSALAQFQQQTSRLPTPLDRWFSTWALQAKQQLQQEALQALERQWQSQVLAEFEQRLANRYPFAHLSATDASLADLEHFFAPRGTFDRFYQQQLAPWLARSGDGALFADEGGVTADAIAAPADPYTELLASVTQVEQIRRWLFNSQGELEMNFWLQPLYLSANKRRSILDLEGQLIDFSHDAGLQTHLIWPNNPEGNGISKLTMIPTERQRSPRSMSTRGPWSLFRLLEQSQTSPHRQAEPILDPQMDRIWMAATDTQNSNSRELEFQIDGGLMRYRLTTESAPLDMALFRQFRLPQTLVTP